MSITFEPNSHYLAYNRYRVTCNQGTNSTIITPQGKKVEGKRTFVWSILYTFDVEFKGIDIEAEIAIIKDVFKTHIII